MNTIHWHLLLNHLPLVGMIIGGLVLSAGYLTNNISVKRTALGILVFTALMAIPAYLTGEGAEEAIESIPGVTDQTIESHEEKGEIFLILCGFLGVLAIVTFITDRLRKNISAYLYAITLFSSIAVSIVAKEVGTSGGSIRHPEINTAVVSENNPAVQNHHDEKDND